MTVLIVLGSIGTPLDFLHCCCQTNSKEDQRRQGDFKALMVAVPFGTGNWQLFNLVSDPGEANDLSELMPEKLDIFKRAWDEYAKEVGVVAK